MSICDEALRIVETANEKGVTLRLLGAIAFRIHCPKSLKLFELSKRELSDIDILGYSKQFNKVIDVITALGYSLMKHHIFSPNRLIFKGTEQNLKIDIFFDKLEMCHTIDFKYRLTIDYPTIPLAEMLLEKMQIVKLADKDLIDTTILLRDHEVREDDDDAINCAYIADVLSHDWGFYYTVTNNLLSVRDNFLPTYSILPEKDKVMVKSRINAILSKMQEKPKSLNWKLRSIIGTRKKWYNDVENLTR